MSKIYLGCSKYLYNYIPAIKEELEKKGHSIILPNSFEYPLQEEDRKKMSAQAHREWKAAMLRAQEQKVRSCDALLVLNFEKNSQPN